MKRVLNWRLAALLGMAGGLIGCETSDSTTTYTHAYYGTGFYDPWYHGDHHHHDDIVVIPPDRDRPRPAHPIAGPPGGFGPRPTPMPSIPHASPRGGRR